MDAFDQFGRLASERLPPTVTAGRYLFQADSEQYILEDVAAKLRLTESSSLLEIGCGAGTLLGPLAAQVRTAVGVDHPSFRPYVEALGLGNLTFVEGRWPKVDVGSQFDRILLYSVFHYLHDAREAEEFLEACFSALAPDGWLLIGDLPNRSAKARFTATAWGQAFAEQWRSQTVSAEGTPSLDLGEVGSFIDDELIVDVVRRCRSRGLEAYVVPQPPELPFANTREDILVWRRPE